MNMIPQILVAAATIIESIINIMNDDARTP